MACVIFKSSGIGYWWEEELLDNWHKRTEDNRRDDNECQRCGYDDTLMWIDLCIGRNLKH